MSWGFNFENSERKPDLKRNSIIVVGAGISGLTVALTLKRAFAQKPAAARPVHVLDKGRGLGGRIATRRTLGGKFDHGALEMHGLDPSLLTNTGLPSNDLISADHILRSDRSTRGLRSNQGQTSWCKAIADALSQGPHPIDLSLNTKVVSMTWSESELGARAVILTCPVPQSVELLGQSRSFVPAPIIDAAERELSAIAAQVSYEPCLVALLKVPTSNLARLIAAYPEVVRAAQYTLASAAPADHTESSTTGVGLTLHWNADFSRAQYDLTDQDLAREFLDRISLFVRSHSDQLNQTLSETEAQLSQIELEVKRWRYATTMRFATEPQTNRPLNAAQIAPGLWLAGDGLSGSTVGAAAESGAEAARQILRALSGRDRTS